MRPIETLISEDELREKVAELAKQIERDYPEPPLVIGVLKGCIYFLSDLTREIRGHCAIDFMAVESYDADVSTGAVKIRLDLATNIEGREVLLVEDIVDTGLTLSYLMNMLASRNPKSLRVMTLLFKPGSFQGCHKPDYIGFEIPNEFVVGYGMDLGEEYRNLKFVGRFRT